MSVGMLQYLALPLRWRMNKVTFSFNTILITTLIVGLITSYHATTAMNDTQRHMYRDKTLGMFKFAYSNYMTRAYPADELMPLSCAGRCRGNRRSRGDIDDSLGNFSLTLIDSLDTLAVLGDVDLFEEAVQNVIRDVTFDTDVVVSVFETNIRVLGGLLGGHVMADHFKHAGLGLSWYNNQLLDKAVDIGRRLLKAFDTASGLPYPRVNLRYGIRPQKSRTGTEKDTCTSCAGTIILEFAALSRLSGDPIYEDKAHAAMDFLWKQRHRASDLVGTVINIHNGDWVRKDSGIGAGIDSYYEYLLKAYVLLGDEKYLTRFNKHYEAVMRYINQGPLMVNVHMHKPMSTSRNYMDALLAFWPGLQVLKGDIASAIEIHEMLYQVIQKHNFLPEAFTTDFRVHWAQHPLRPEFIESTYFLYKATGDPHYLEVGAMVLDNLEKHAKVKCGYAAIKDVTTGKHEDQMDSFVLAETFKYLYLLFADKSDVKLNVDDYIFTTEAHLLPLSLGLNNSTGQDVVVELKSSNDSTVSAGDRTCPNSMFLFPGDSNYAYSIRNPLKNLVSNTCAKNKQRSRPRLRASHFVAGDASQAETLGRMGIKIMTMSDGRVQLLHSTNDAATVEEAEDGLMFMEEMIELSRTQQQQEGTHEPRVVQLISAPFFGHETYNAGPAQFGPEFGKDEGYTGDVVLAEPLSGCSAIQNAKIVRNKIAIVERGQCMFIDKARHLEAAGVMGAIVLDTTPDLSSESSPLFAMSGDGTDNVHIPMVFLFRVEADKLLGHLEAHPDLRVFIGKTTRKSDTIMREMLQAKHIALSYIDTQRDTSDEGYVSDEDETVSYMDESDLEPEWTEQSQLLLDVIEGRRDVTEATSAIFGEQTDVYSHLIESLNKYTNFDSLPNKDTYMDALSDLSDGRLQDAAQRTSDRLTQLMNVLKSVAPPLQKESDQESTGKASTSTTGGNILLDMIRYLDEPPSWMKLEDVEDLLEESVKISTADVSRKLEQWRNLILDSVELKEGRGTGTSGKGGTSSNPTGTADSSTTGSNSNTGTHSGSTGTGSDSIDSGTLAYDSKTGYRHPDTLPLPTDSTNSRTTSRHSKHKGFSKDEL